MMHMTKYSTGSSDEPNPSDESASCSLCGSTDNLTTDEIAGAEVVVCSSCASEDSVTDQQSDEGNEERRSESFGSEDDEGSSGYTITDPDSSWVEEDRPDYGNARTPYMVSDYAERLNDSLRSKDMSLGELSEETGVKIESVEAVSEGEALSEDITAEEISVIAEHLNVELVEDV